MPIATTCPNCQALFRLPDDMVGRRVKCQKCASLFEVPRGEAETTVPGVPVLIEAQPIPEPAPPVAAASLSLPPLPIDPPAPAPQAGADEDRDDDDDRYGKTKPPPLRKRSADDRSSRSGRDEKPKAKSSKLGIVLAVAGLSALFCIACAGGSVAIYLLDGGAVQKKMQQPVAKDGFRKDGFAKGGKDIAKEVFKDFDKDFPRKDKVDVFPIKKMPFPQPPAINVVLGNDGFFRNDNQLAPNDPFNFVNKNHKVYSLTLEAGQTYQFDMVSNQFDSYLYILDDTNGIVAFDDDSGGNFNARIVMTAKKTGVYRIEATSFAPDQFGQYTLTIQRFKN
jgi:predicted Zn finger-like uncharacterized protein